MGINQTSPAVELLNRWRGGDQAAAKLLFELYSDKLTVLADSYLSDRLRRRVAGEDIAQSALRTFFRRKACGEFHVDSEAGLWRLLVTITLAKVRTHARHHTAQIRDVNAEVAGVGDEWFYEAIAQEPGPQEAATLTDLVEAVLEGLPSAHGEILALRLEGHTNEDIAGKLGVSRQTIQRALSFLRQRLQRILAEPDVEQE
jgi:RNA polymerase sigma factor (sigma-70 family)